MKKWCGVHTIIHGDRAFGSLVIDEVGIRELDHGRNGRVWSLLRVVEKKLAQIGFPGKGVLDFEDDRETLAKIPC